MIGVWMIIINHWDQLGSILCKQLLNMIGVWMIIINHGDQLGSILLVSE